MTNPMSEYLERELSIRFTLLKLWTHSSKPRFFKQNSNLIKAVVGDTNCGADAEMIESLPRLEIVASYSFGLDKSDLEKCREKGVRVTNTPDVLTDDVADLAIGLIMAVLRRVSSSDGFVRCGNWKDGDFRLATKFSGKSVGIAGLDVYKNEPEVPEQLLGLDNEILLPHVGSDTEETSKAMADLMIRNLEAYFGNKPLLTPVL